MVQLLSTRIVLPVSDEYLEIRLKYSFVKYRLFKPGLILINVLERQIGTHICLHSYMFMSVYLISS